MQYSPVLTRARRFSLKLRMGSSSALPMRKPPDLMRIMPPGQPFFSTAAADATSSGFTASTGGARGAPAEPDSAGEPSAGGFPSAMGVGGTGVGATGVGSGT